MILNITIFINILNFIFQLELQAFNGIADNRELSNSGDTSLTITINNNDTSTPSKFIIDTDYIKILKKDLKSINCSVESNPTEIWEKLNSKCHKLFGYSDKIKIDKVEDLEWAKSILPAYIHWDIFSDYHARLDLDLRYGSIYRGTQTGSP